VKQIRKRLTYSNVMSSLAVFLVLGGGAAVAATKIGAGDLKANSVKTGKIVKEAVTTSKLKSGSVVTTKIANGAVTGAQLADGSVDGAKIADNAVGTAKIADNAVNTAKIADKAVTGAKINVTTLGTVPKATSATSAATAEVADGVAGEFFAMVASDGSLVRGTPGVTSKNEGTGTFRVIVGTPTEDCFTVATLGGNNPGGNNLGEISVNPSSTNKESFWIDTANPAGTLTNQPFTLYARC